MDSRAHANVLPVVQGNDTPLKNGIARSFLKVKDPDVDKYLAMLAKDENDLVRINAIKSLGAHARVENLPVLKEALSDENSAVRRMTVTQIGKIDSEEALDALLEYAAKETEDEVMVNLVLALGEFGNDRAVEPLIKYLNSEFWAIRNNASWALVLIGSDEVLKWVHHVTRRAENREAFSSAVFIENILKGTYSPAHFIDEFRTQKNDEMRCSALISLKEYARHTLWYGDEERRPAEKTKEYEAKLRPTTQAILTSLRKTDDFNERACAAECLGWYPEHIDIVPALLKAVEDENNEVSNFAFDGLIRQGGKDELRKIVLRARGVRMQESDEEKMFRWCNAQLIELGIE